jgi:hypothetical protein
LSTINGNLRAECLGKVSSKLAKTQLLRCAQKLRAGGLLDGSQSGANLQQLVDHRGSSIANSLTGVRLHELQRRALSVLTTSIDAAPVLVVGDDPTARRAARRVLTQAGYEVRTAASVGEARRALVNGGIGVIVLDVFSAGRERTRAPAPAQA